MLNSMGTFLDFIRRTKPYMDGLWDDEHGWYAEPDHDTGKPVAVTYANAHMIALVAMLAGHGLADEEDIARVRRLLETHWTVEPAYIGSTWLHALGDPSRDYHQANDQVCAEATYFAWKYRDALAIKPELAEDLRVILTEDRVMGEYNATCFGGSIYYPEFADVFSLSEEEQARMRAWQRKILGSWQRNGLPNWDTQYDCYRLYNGQYWGWAIQGLLAMARPGALNMGTDDHHYARWIFDRALDTFSRMDTWRLLCVDEHDPADGVPPPNVVPDRWLVRGSVRYVAMAQGQARPEVNSKSAFAASFLRHAAHAIEVGIHEVAPREPKTLWRWDWHNRAVYVSTPVYDAASLPKAGTYSMWKVPHTIGNQHWGVSRVAAPDGQILTPQGSPSATGPR